MDTFHGLLLHADLRPQSSFYSTSPKSSNLKEVDSGLNTDEERDIEFTLHIKDKRTVKFLFEISVLVLSVPPFPLALHLDSTSPFAGCTIKISLLFSTFKLWPWICLSYSANQDSQKKVTIVPQAHPLGSILPH